MHQKVEGKRNGNRAVESGGGECETAKREENGPEELSVRERKDRKEPEGKTVITRCAWCNSIQNNIGGWESAEDAGDSEQECPITHTMCLECLKRTDPELHKAVSAILEEEQRGQGG